VQTLRNIIAVVLTATAFGACYVLLQRVIGPTSPWLGLLLLFYFMGLMNVAQPLFTLRLPEAIAEVRPWERVGNIYRLLAVFAFGKLLRETPLRRLNSSVYLVRGRTDLLRLHRRAISSEAIHFWAMVLFMPYILFVWFQGDVGTATIFMAIQVLFNIYPILHLRTLRGRLDRLIAFRQEMGGDTNMSSSP